MKPRRRGLWSATTMLAAILVSAGAVQAQSPTSRANAKARVQGTFVMDAQITAAVNVRGERRGQHVKRLWLLAPLGCTGTAGPCPTLRLVRQRAEGARDTTLLHRTARGGYTGSGAFYAPLRCQNRIYKRGARAPYRIFLTVTSSASVQGIAFAIRLHATYLNLARSDATPCPLGPSHDAATYSGAAIAPAPGPPTPTVLASEAGSTAQFRFVAGTVPSPGAARIVALTWDFGDPSSGASDHASAPTAVHAFTRPGVYSVSLKVTDANGLTGSALTQVIVPAPPGAGIASRRRR